MSLVYRSGPLINGILLHLDDYWTLQFPKSSGLNPLNTAAKGANITGMDGWPPGLSETILATLGLILAASLAVFSILGKRVPRRQHELALRQWAAQHQAVVLDPPLPRPPQALELLSLYHPSFRQVIQCDQWTLAELTPDPPAEAKGKTPRWRLLVLRTAS